MESPSIHTSYSDVDLGLSYRSVYTGDLQDQCSDILILNVLQSEVKYDECQVK